MSDDNGRIDELEIKLSFQEQVIAELNDVVTAQAGRLADLERQLQLIGTRLDSESDGDSNNQPEPPPPHY